MIVEITKNEDNSATLKIETINKMLPFPLLFDHFTSSTGEQSIFQLSLNLDSGSYQLNPTLISTTSDSITLQFNLPFNVESFPATLIISPYKTRYLPEDDTLNFNLEGTNQALKYS